MSFIKNKLTKYIYKKIKGPQKAHIPRPVFNSRNHQAGKPLLIACANGFNQDFQIAGTIMREGFARGWAEACGPAKLIPAVNIIKEINNYENPAVYMSEFEFQYLSYQDIRALRDVDLFVWVGVHPRKQAEIEKMTLLNRNEIEISLDCYGKVIFAEPKFVCNAVGEASRDFYRGWKDDGLKWETIYPAVDISRYYPELNIEKYGDIKMAYVGGYWEEKAQAFTEYLRPWEDIFHPFGYAVWPYKNYGGGLTPKQERQLYTSAGLVPLVTTPAGWLMAEITERYLKAPACKAFCIADQNPALREIFNNDEMIQAKDSEQFHYLVNEYLKGNIDVVHWKEKAYNAVNERHLYRHRALQIKRALER